MHFIAGVPLVIALVSFVLTMLAIFAGNQPEFMEDYHIVYLNTSTLGQNIISKLKVRNMPMPMPIPTLAPLPDLHGRFHATEKAKRIDIDGVIGDVTDGVDGAIGAATSVVGAAGSAVTSAAGAAASAGLGALSDIENDIADKLAKALGIKQFYSIYLADMCEGDFKPNATAKDATFNVMTCTKAFDYDLLNITALLDHELSIGPLDLNIADLDLTKDIQDKLNDIPKIIRAIVAFYIMAAVFILLSALSSAAGIVLIPGTSSRKIIMVNLGLAGLALLSLLIGNLITTVGGNMVVEAIDKFGEAIGLSAAQGDSFLGLTWATFALMLIVVCAWACEFITDKKRVSETHARAIGGSPYMKNEAWTSSSPSMGGGPPLQGGPMAMQGDSMAGDGSPYPPTHAPRGLEPAPISPMDDVPIDGGHLGPRPVSYEPIASHNPYGYPGVHNPYGYHNNGQESYGQGEASVDGPFEPSPLTPTMLGPPGGHVNFPGGPPEPAHYRY